MSEFEKNERMAEGAEAESRQEISAEGTPAPTAVREDADSTGGQGKNLLLRMLLWGNVGVPMLYLVIILLMGGAQLLTNPLALYQFLGPFVYTTVIPISVTVLCLYGLVGKYRQYDSFETSGRSFGGSALLYGIATLVGVAVIVALGVAVTVMAGWGSVGY